MVRVYLVQHAKAFSKEEDPDRNLTPEGEYDISKICECLKENKLHLDHIYHSGKTRTLQTARLIADQINPDIVIEQKENLSPTDDPSLLAMVINESTTDDLYVGHMPHMQKLASYLLVGDSEKKVIEFHNAGIVCLENLGEGWFIQWIVVPTLFPKKGIDSGMYV